MGALQLKNDFNAIKPTFSHGKKRISTGRAAVFLGALLVSGIMAGAHASTASEPQKIIQLEKREWAKRDSSEEKSAPLGAMQLQIGSREPNLCGIPSDFAFGESPIQETLGLLQIGIASDDLFVEIYPSGYCGVRGPISTKEIYNSFYSQIKQFLTEDSQARIETLALGFSRERLKTGRIFDLKKPEYFFDICRVLFGNRAEEEKLQVMAYWGSAFGGLGATKDYIHHTDATKMVINYMKGETVGICGDINGSLLKRMANELGLQHASMIVDNPDWDVSHLVAFVKGSKNYYLVDYGKITNLGTDGRKAVETTMKSYGMFVPFPLSWDKSGVLFQSESDKLLFSTINWYKDKINDEFSLGLEATTSGAISARNQRQYKNFTLGAFYLNSPFALNEGFGAYLNFRARDNEEKSLLGITYLPAVDFVAMTAKTNSRAYNLALYKLEPVLLSSFPTDKFQIKLSPLKAESAYATKDKANFKATSNAGFILHFDGKKQLFANVEVGYTPRNDFYGMNYPDAMQTTVGFESPKTSLKLKYYPQGMISRVEAEAAHRINTRRFGSIMLFGNFSLPDKTLYFGTQILLGSSNKHLGQ